VVVLAVVVLVGTPQLGPAPGAGHASQQLAQLPTVPCLVAQWAASFANLHFGPAAVVKQQVTAPCRPQVERDAHFRTAPAQLGLTSVAFACGAAQLTYTPWVGAPAQSQAAATAARALATSDASGSVVGSHFAYTPAPASSIATAAAAAPTYLCPRDVSIERLRRSPAGRTHATRSSSCP
jgi:hypothetical protein